MDAKTRRLYRGDCLEILQDYIEPESVDLIYLDPPFNSKSIYNLPFRGQDKTHEAVEAFVDTWTWTPEHDLRLHDFRRSAEPLPSIASVIEFAQGIEPGRAKGRARETSLAAYLVNMAERLLAMKPALKPTGSVYLHCDPTASHYLKLIMDAILGRKNFRNEIVWRIGWVSGYKTRKKGWIRNHDTIFYYKGSGTPVFNKEYIPYPPDYRRRDGSRPRGKGIPIEDTWNCNAADILDSIMIKSFSREKLGYPTQKPLALLERIIRASSNPGDLVLDPFCGCGTTLHAAENLERQWIGVDVSRFAVELMRERVVSNYPHRLRELDEITIIGLPENVADARRLARQDPFEFEKWVCGRIGASGMGRRLGARGADGGIDGVIELAAIRGKRVVQETAIVQVKGGNVTPDSVRALSEIVRRTGSVAGIMVCFADQLGTVENQRSREIWSDASGSYPVIQGFSIEDLLDGKRPLLPPQYGRRRGARLSA